jgi:hypothetical protein
MRLTATARSIAGTPRREVVIDGRHRLITDEPRHVGGDGSGPAPHELYPAARLEKVARACSLRGSIEAGVEFVESIERPEGATRHEPVERGGAS